MSIDPRLMERRRVVAEDKARRNMRRLLRLMIVVAVVGAGTWFMLSPFMSVKEITVTGVSASNTVEVMVDHDLVVDRPMILLRPPEIEEAIEADPWIVDASVRRSWPNGVIVRVEERVPAAWVQTDEGWARRSIDGHALPSSNEPDDSLGWVRLKSVAGAKAVESPVVLGAIEFVDALPNDLASETIVRLAGNGELWAEVDGHQVRLGRPVEMTAKALSLVALLEVDPPKTAVLTLIAPTNPAVTPNRSLPPSQEESDGEAGEGGGEG